MDNFSFDEKDLFTEIFRSDEPQTEEERIASWTDAPIRVTHLPTGLKAIGQGQGSQIKNKEKALEILKELVVGNSRNN